MSRETKSPRLLPSFLDVLLDRRTRPFVILVGIIIALGAGLYHWLEGWSWLNSVYSW